MPHLVPHKRFEPLLKMYRFYTICETLEQCPLGIVSSGGLCIDNQTDQEKMIANGRPQATVANRSAEQGLILDLKHGFLFPAPTLERALTTHKAHVRLYLEFVVKSYASSKPKTKADT